MSGLGEFRQLQGLLGHSGHFVRPDGPSGPSGSYGPSGQPGSSGSAGPSATTENQLIPVLLRPNAFPTTISDFVMAGGNYRKINQGFLQSSLLSFPLLKVSEINGLISKPKKRTVLGERSGMERVVDAQIGRPFDTGLANKYSGIPEPSKGHYAGTLGISGPSGNPGNVPYGSQGISGPSGNLGISGTFGNPGISGTLGNQGISGTFGNLGSSGPSGNPVINSAEEILKVKLSEILNPLADVCLNNKFGLVFADNSGLPQIMIDDFGKVLYLYDQEGSTAGTWIVLPKASANKSPESDSDAVKWAIKFSIAVPNMINQANSDVTGGVAAFSMVQPDFTPLKKALRIYANKNDQSYTVKLNNESINYDYVVVQLPKEFQNNTLMLFKEELMV